VVKKSSVKDAEEHRTGIRNLLICSCFC